MLLSKLFEDMKVEKNYVANEFFVKNKEKYFANGELEEYRDNKKLKYMDSFLTRYVYYSFQRWCVRLGQFLSVYEE